MSGRQLKLARTAMGWTQLELIVRLETAGRRHGFRVATRPSLKTMISCWENGRVVPAEDYRRLLREIYGMTDADLGFVERSDRIADESQGVAASEIDVFGSTPVLPDSLGSDTLGYLRAVLVEYIRADSLLGPRHLRSVIAAQLGFIEQLCATARGAIRTQLLDLAAHFAEFAGWIHQDAGDLKSALHWSNRSVDFAQENGDPRLISYVLMRKSNVATDAEQAAQALGLANAAYREHDRLTPGLRALALRQRAHAHALAREPDDCVRALDQAMREVTAHRSELELGDLTGYCVPSYIEMEAVACWSRLGRPDRAVPIYERSLAGYPAGQQRDRGLCLSRLAATHALGGHVDRAATVGLDAAHAVRIAPSARALAELRRLRIALAPHRSLGVVSDLNEALAGLP